MLYQWQNTVKCAGVLYAAGDVIEGGMIPPGSLESCLRVGHLKPVAAKSDPADGFAAFMDRATTEAAAVFGIPAAVAGEPNPEPVAVGPPGEANPEPPPAEPQPAPAPAPKPAKPFKRK